jgi:hypothetical protein
MCGNLGVCAYTVLMVVFSCLLYIVTAYRVLAVCISTMCGVQAVWISTMYVFLFSCPYLYRAECSVPAIGICSVCGVLDVSTCTAFCVLTLGTRTVYGVLVDLPAKSVVFYLCTCSERSLAVSLCPVCGGLAVCNCTCTVLGVLAAVMF